VPYTVDNGVTTYQRNPLKFSGVTAVILDHVSVPLEYYTIKHKPYADLGCRKVKKTGDCKALHPPNNATHTVL